jgi:hypothetical protein
MSKLIKILCEEFGVPDGTAVPGMNSVEQVNSKIERAEKTEEVDTVTFGLETDDGRIIKVYVKAEEAEDFEEALSKELGSEDVIEDVLNKLSKDFDIIDVEWPDQQNSDDEESEEDDELSVDDVDMDGKDEKDGSSSLNKKVWGSKSGREKTKHLVKKESDMSYGQLFTKKILGEQDLEEAKRFVTVINGKEKVFGAFDEEAAQKLANRWGGDKVKPYVGHQKGGAKKKVAEGVKLFKSIDDIVEEFGPKVITDWLSGFQDSSDLEDAIIEYYSNNGEMPYGTQKARSGDPYNWIADHFPDDLAAAGYIDKKTHKWIAKEAISQSKLTQLGNSEILSLIYDNAKAKKYDEFEYPNYAGLPKAVSNKLSPDFVDAIQNCWDFIFTKDKNNWLKMAKTELKNLGENLNEFKYETPADKEATAVKQPGGRHYKVGLLDSRFTTIYQFMIYQALLDLGIPDEALNKAPQKSAIVTSIKTTAAELQKDPVRRQALRFLINRLKETADVTEAKKVEELPDDADTDNDGNLTAKEKKEAEALKVGHLDDRFVTLIQKMVYQTILMLGLPDAFMTKSAYKNTMINSIKAKAKEIQKDSVKRSALRIFTHRFAEVNEHINATVKFYQDGPYFYEHKTNKLIASYKHLVKGDNDLEGAKKALAQFKKEYPDFELVLDEELITENAGNQAVDFIEFFIDSFIPESKKAIGDNLKSSSVWQATKRAIISNGDAAQILQSVRAQLGSVSSKMAAKGSATPFKEHLDIVNEANEPTENTQKLIKYIQDSRRTVQADIKSESDPKTRKHLQNAVEAMDKAEENAQKGNLLRAAWYSLRVSTHMQKAINQAELSEAKWGDEPMLDDPADKETDPDTKVKANLPKRKKDKRTGEEAEWEITKVKKTGELTLETEGLVITLDDESAEKLIKAIANKSIAILPDSELSGTKWVFSPRARTYMVKQAGKAAAVKPLILTWDDTNKIEDVYIGK